MIKRLNILVKGRVQGVGFRYHAAYAADKHNITGWAKNLFDGDVEIEAQGEEENLDKFIRELYKGNGFIKITSMDKKIISEKTNEKKFKALY
ncbi:acylphosphatase [Clostridium polynesiense]|uniref:acylphosphatase n=1 Tax=Clostridium polynesiense TaxID=1325933 RepID=UPI00058DD9DB|nr:acylphosphatase [Clostridium polynesiense]